MTSPPFHRIHEIVVFFGSSSALLEPLRLMPHAIRPVINSSFAFEDARQAYEKMLGRRFFGKIVVRVAP